MSLLKNPFLLRSVEPSAQACEGRKVVGLRRLGKRIAIGFDGDLWLVIHLMIAGRLHWYAARIECAAQDASAPRAATRIHERHTHPHEAGTKRRASLYVVAGEASLSEHDRGGLEVLEANLDQFR